MFIKLNCIIIHLWKENLNSDGQEEFEDNKGVNRICISKKNRQHNGQKKKSQEAFEDTKGVIWIRISKKDRRHNGQQKKYKRQKMIYKT